MIYFLYTIFFSSCVALILSVLLQPGKTDAGALFTSNISSSAFQPRGTQTILSKITIVAATLFMLSALFIAMPALQGGSSVLNSNPETVTETTVPPAAADVSNTANTNAQANTAQPANTNATAPNNTANTNSAANANK